MSVDSSGGRGANGEARAASIRRGLTLLWEGLPGGDRGPKRALSLEQIVAAAIAIADEAGVDSLSMRRIATELGVGTMSLYRYVPDRAALMDLVLDHLVVPSQTWQADELPGSGPSWRRALALSAQEGRTLYLAHEWLIQLNWSRPTFGPNTIGSLERIVARMHDLPVPDKTRIDLTTAVDGYVTGAVRAQLMYQRAAQETGLSDEEYWELQYPVLERAMASGHYPAMAVLAEDSFTGGWEEVFELGLRALLDGIAVRFDV